MNTKENWINEIMDVVERIETPRVPLHVLEKLKAIPANVKHTINKVPTRTIWLAAASIAALIALNVFFFSKAEMNDASTNEIAESYFSYTKQL